MGFILSPIAPAQTILAPIFQTKPSTPSGITRVEIVKNSGACSSGLSVSFGTPTTTGELIVVTYFASPTAGNAGTITDNKSGGTSTYTKDGEITNLGSHGVFGTQHTANAASGISQITITSTSQSACAIIAAHYTGLASSPLDQNTGNPTSSGAQSTSYNFSSSTVSTVSSNELLVGAVGCQASTGANCTFTGTGIWNSTLAAQQLVNGARSAVGYQELIVSTTQSSIANTGTATSGTMFVAPMLITFHQ